MIRPSDQQSSPQMKWLGSRLLPIFVTVVGLFTILWGTLSLMEAKESVDWSTTPGTVLSSSVYDSTSHDVDVKESAYHADVIYEYYVDDKLYSGDRIAFGDYGPVDSSHAEDIVSRYLVGMDVTVFYMPDSPDESVLEPGMTAQSSYVLGFGLLFFIMGVLLFIYMSALDEKQMQKQKDDGEYSELP